MREKQTITLADVGKLSAAELIGESSPLHVVVATGAASLSNVPSLASRIEAAMAQAVKDSFADGVTEPDKVRARMLEAREVVKTEFHREAAERASRPKA